MHRKMPYQNTWLDKLLKHGLISSIAVEFILDNNKDIEKVIATQAGEDISDKAFSEVILEDVDENGLWDE